MISILAPIIAVISGFILVLILKPKKPKHLKLLLAFSGAFLLSVTVFDFLPHVYESHDKVIGLFIMVGILLQIVLEFFSQGAEHGHVHIHKNATNFPWSLFISLSIHSILEGIPIEANHNLLYGIIIHKLPIAIILTTFFTSSNISKAKSFMFLCFFALMTPIGVLLAKNVNIVQEFHVIISAIVIGIFLHISTTILFESSEGHKFNLAKLSSIILAVVIAYFI